MLSNRFGTRFFIVMEYSIKTEYQGRGTPHWHIAAWVVCFGLLADLAGRTKKVVSAFVRFLELVFRCDIDVQVGNLSLILEKLDKVRDVPFRAESGHCSDCLVLGCGVWCSEHLNAYSGAVPAVRTQIPGARYLVPCST